MQPELTCQRPTEKFPNGRTGTQAGYLAHRRAGEQACDLCLAARAAYSRAYYTPTGNPPGRAPVTEEHKREVNRLYGRRWRDAHPERMRELNRRYDKKRDPGRVKANARQQGQRRRAFMNALKSGPCTDCGVSYPYYVMHFDHRDPSTKLFNIGSGSHPMDVLLAEIEKCDLVCANCHAERTWGPGRKDSASEQNLRAG